MSSTRRMLPLLLLVSVLVGCNVPAAAGMPLALPSSTSGPQATYVLASGDATATPTPFQPLPPTPIFLPTNQPLPTLPVPPSPTPTVGVPVENFAGIQPIAQPPSQINVLLLGSDKRPWESGFRTDTIILVTLNFDLGRVNITSFPRDLYLTLPGWGVGRINTAWTYGGQKLLMETFQHNFGVAPDFYVLINFSSFKKIIDGLGGLVVKVGEPLSDYRAGYWVNIPAGEVHMDADTVLWYVRSRKTTNDIARNRRQQEVLQAIFEKLLSLNAIRRAPEFYEAYKDSVKSDIRIIDVLTWLPFAAKIAETREIHQYYITYKHVNDWITPEGAMVLLPNRDALMSVIRKSQNIP